MRSVLLLHGDTLGVARGEIAYIHVLIQLVMPGSQTEHDHLCFSLDSRWLLSCGCGVLYRDLMIVVLSVLVTVFSSHSCPAPSFAILSASSFPWVPPCQALQPGNAGTAARG